jgi:asparagine synthase (glutamine-hydrolysing)
MTVALRHRGPDAFGLYEDQLASLGHTRLSVIDLAGGRQPMANEDQTLWLTFNGEIYNYRELRPALERRGHRFRTESDTEVILHLYESFGKRCLDYLNGQFAIALWDIRKRQIFLARDRFGIRPLYYATTSYGIAFASEMKSLFQAPGLQPRLDPRALDETFTFWSAQAPRTPFCDISQMPPGQWLLASQESLSAGRYWDMPFPDAACYAAAPREEVFTEELLEALSLAVRLRMRADVPVAGYLSGGLDSSLTTALIRRVSDAPLDTFSIRFDHPAYDEGAYQQAMRGVLQTRHESVFVDADSVAENFVRTIWHAETPILRTAPVPLLALSGLVRQHGTKVVVTGEGADELFAGYNIFKEAKVRRFWARHPDSILRPLLLARLYPYLKRQPGAAGAASWRRFFAKGLLDTRDPGYSHRIRWANTAALKRFFSPDLRNAIGPYDAMEGFLDTLPEDAAHWDPLSRAQYIEIKSFMGGYLLSSQGDRVAMANSVEGRFPFLDHHVATVAANAPPHYRLRVLEEKHVLRRAAQGLVPESIQARPKQPYRAPDTMTFRCPSGQALIEEYMSEESITGAGYFNPRMVTNLIRKVLTVDVEAITPREDMAMTGILSTQILHHLFLETSRPPDLPAEETFFHATPDRAACGAPQREEALI